MKALLYIGGALVLVYLIKPDLLTSLGQMVGVQIGGKGTTQTTTGTPAPLSNPKAPTTIGTLNITGSRFGVARTSPSNSLV